MLTFKQFLLEGKAKILSLQTPSRPFPISINARNVRVAIQELSNAVTKDISFVDSDSDSIKEASGDLRGLYHTKTNKIYVWFGIDALHGTIEPVFNIKSLHSIHLTIFSNVANAWSNSDGPMDNPHRFSSAEIKKWETDIVKFVGRNKNLNFAVAL